MATSNESNSNKIQILKNNLSNKPGILAKLEKALSYIKPDALFILPPH